MHDQALAELLALERKNELYRERVLGYPVWPLTRLNRYTSTLTRRQTGFDVERVGVGRTLERFARPVWRSLRQAPSVGEKLRRHDVWLLDASNHRRRDGDRTVCIFAEHLREQYGERLLEVSYDTGGVVDADSEHVLHIDALMIGALGAGELLARLGADELVRAPQRERFEVAHAGRLVRAAVYGRAMAAAARPALRSSRPKAVFVICGYNFFIPIQREAKQLGIPVIELQHGIIHESHSGYFFAGDEPPAHLPDHVVVFGEHFGEIMERGHPYWRGRWSVGGHDWLVRKRRASAQKPRHTVFLFTQYLSALREPLREWIRPLRRALPETLSLVVKPHPAEHDAASFYRDVLGAGVRLASHQEDSYELLNHAVAAASYYSTLTIEALAYPSHAVAIESPHWPADIRRFVEAGFLRRASSPEELAAIAQQPVASEGDDDDLARRLFGIGAPPLDFKRLVEVVRSTSSG
ncbi:MAG: hypothetical protein AAGA56_15895 [Myxococcota bacterium]